MATKKAEIAGLLPPHRDSRLLGEVREEAERKHILAILHLTDGKRGEAAQILGISRKTLWKRMKQLGLA